MNTNNFPIELSCFWVGLKNDIRIENTKIFKKVYFSPFQPPQSHAMDLEVIAGAMLLDLSMAPSPTALLGWIDPE